MSLAILTRNDIGEVARLTAANAKTGQGRQADANRAASELAQREQDVAGAEARRLQASHRLCELLNLDTTTRLQPVESQVVPEPVVPTRIPLAELIATALLHRPELSARRTAVKAALLELRSAKLLPFSPTVLGGFSDGVFGGGSSIGSSEGLPRFDNFADRSDVDVVVYWTLRNLGLGNKALIDAARAARRVAVGGDGGARPRASGSRHRVRPLASPFCRNRHAGAGRAAGNECDAGGPARIRGQQGLPIELLDSLRQAGTARTDYLNAIIGFDEAEFQLYVALGAPPADTLARPVPDDVMHPPTQILKP